MASKRINLKNFRKGRILRVEELKECVEKNQPVWVYVKEYTKPKAKVDHTELGTKTEDSVKFSTTLFCFKGLKNQDNCSVILDKKAILKVYKAIATRRVSNDSKNK
jgi:uncharacterized protein YvpB